MAEEVLQGMARSWRADSLTRLCRSEFENPGILDGFCTTTSGGRSRALGFPLAFHLGAGTVPGVATTSLIRSLLVKSALLLRPSRNDLPLPLAFCRALAEEDPGLSEGVALLYWPSGESQRTESVVEEVDLVVAYGGDETISWIRSRLPPTTSFRAYRHRMGFGLVGQDALRDEEGARGVAEDAARAVALFDQRGCVSPHALFVEEGGVIEPRHWAEFLADALEGIEGELPSGTVPAGTAVSIQQFRGAYELEEAVGSAMIRHGGKEAPWTVVFEPKGFPGPSCLNRVVTVLPVQSLEVAISFLRHWRPYLQTVAVEGFGTRTAEAVEGLARLGVSRVAPFGAVPWPEAWWHHDGSGPLQDLVRWTDVEGVAG
jgi:hypothetical protein